MNRTILHGVQALATAAAIVLLTPGAALAHTGSGASTRHVITEMGLWGLGIVATLAIVVSIFWVRARLIRRFRS